MWAVHFSFIITFQIKILIELLLYYYVTLSGVGIFSSQQLLIR